MDSATAAVMGSTSTSLQGVAVASATASLTPGNNGASLPWPGIGTGSNPNVNASGVPFLLLIAALMTGGGVFFAFKLRGRKPAYDPSLAGGGGAAATMPIHPATVGAFGFTAWLAGQAPMLSQGEQVVLSKVRNGIGSAIQLVGGVSDLKKISEMGTQEFLQLTANSTFPLSGIQRTGFAGG